MTPATWADCSLSLMDPLTGIPTSEAALRQQLAQLSAYVRARPQSDLFADYELTVICNDHFSTQVTVHWDSKIDILRLGP
jgi:hypothetical protein